MLGVLLAIVLSIGAVDALVPLMIIVILIVAAAGATRGYSIFNLFGIATLAGIGVGRGSFSGRSALGRYFIIVPSAKLSYARKGKRGFIVSRIQRRLERRRDMKRHIGSPVSLSAGKKVTIGKEAAKQKGRVRMAAGRAAARVKRVRSGTKRFAKNLWEKKAVRGVRAAVKYTALYSVPPIGAAVTAIKLRRNRKLNKLGVGDRSELRKSTELRKVTKKLMHYALWISPPVAIAATMMRKKKAGSLEFRRAESLQRIPGARAIPLPARPVKPTTLQRELATAKKHAAQMEEIARVKSAPDRTAYMSSYTSSRAERLNGHENELKGIGGRIAAAIENGDKAGERAARKEYKKEWDAVDREITGRSRFYVPSEWQSSAVGSLVASLGYIASMQMTSAHAMAAGATGNKAAYSKAQERIRDTVANFGGRMGGRGNSRVREETEEERKRKEENYSWSQRRREDNINQTTTVGAQARPSGGIGKEVEHVRAGVETTGESTRTTNTDIGRAYRYLGVGPDATDEEVRRAYRNMAKEYHPDVGGSNEKFVELTLAYDRILKSRKSGDRNGT